MGLGRGRDASAISRCRICCSARKLAGGLHALRLDTGAPVWEARPPRADCKDPTNCVQAQSAAITLIPGAVFSGTTTGLMRAYDTTDGRVIWTYDAESAVHDRERRDGQGRLVQRARARSSPAAWCS